MQLAHYSNPVIPRDRLIDLEPVCNLAGVKKSTIYAWLKDSQSDFPKPIRLSARMVRWSESAVLQWVQDRINQQQPQANQAHSGANFRNVQGVQS